MQLESHAIPLQESPQQRYAALHRAIERGLDSDEVWRELAGVALSLGYGDEAVQCARRIQNDALRFALESALSRRGLNTTPTPPASAQHRAAPAASSAGTTHGEAHAPSLREHVVDAFQYLTHQHMPWLVLLTTLAFPLLVGLGGLLTAGGSPLLLAAIAALPGLCIVAILGAMGRHILAASAEGSGDVPSLPGWSQLVADARRFLFDATLVLGCLVGPSLLGIWLGAPLVSTLPGLLVGAFFAPLAWALRHLDLGMAALSPVHLLRGLARTGRHYVAFAGVVVGLFAPAVLVAALASGRPVWVQIAVVGPLVVLPVFVASRLVGTWLDAHRAALVRRPARNSQPQVARAPVAAPAPRPERQLRRPEALEHFQAPAIGRGRHAARHPAPTPRPVAAPAKPTSRAIEGRQPAPRTKAPAPAAPAPAAPAPARPAAAKPAAAAAPRQALGARPR